MRRSQLVIRVVVFCCVALDPSGGATGIVVGVILASIIAFADCKIRAIQTAEQDNDAQ